MRASNEPDNENETEQTFDTDDLPASAVVKVIRPDKYGSISDLDDEELADPEELERIVIIEFLAPLLLFLRHDKFSWIEPYHDCVQS